MSYDEGYDDGGYDDGGYDDEGYDDEYGDGNNNDYEEEDYDEEEEQYKKNYGKTNKIFLGKKTKRDENEKYYKEDKENGEDDEDDEDDEDEDDEEDNEVNDDDSEDGGDGEEDSYEFNCETGEIGEEIVYKNLKGLKHKGKIKWMNKDGESFLPYDFVFKKGNKTIYVDAKSTIYEKGNDPELVISQNEEEFINKLKPNEKYYIGRVYDARSENPKIVYYDARTREKVDEL